MVVFPQKVLLQVAALPFVCPERGIEVLLTTSRRRGRWILPKGSPGKTPSLAEAAAREALEETGVVGVVGDASVGAYTYRKRMPTGYQVPCRVHVYPLLVLEHRLTWRERQERSFRWCRLDRAAALVDDAGLARILEKLARGSGETLRSLAHEVARGGTTMSALTGQHGAG